MLFSAFDARGHKRTRVREEDEKKIALKIESFRFSVWTHSESPLSAPSAGLRSTASVRVFAPVTVVLEAGLQDALEEDKRWWQILEAQMCRCRCVSIYTYIHIYMLIYNIYIYIYINVYV